MKEHYVPTRAKKRSRAKAADRRLKLLLPLCTVLTVILTAAALLVFAGPRSSFAITVDSGDCGLVVETAAEPVDTGNLNPGDVKASYLVARNTKDAPLQYWMDIVMTGRSPGSYPGLEGRPLDEVLQLTIKRGDQVLFEGLIAQFSEMNMGALAGNAQQRIDVIASLDGPAVGNEYQGASVSLLFKFRSSCAPPPGGDATEGEETPVPLDVPPAPPQLPAPTQQPAPPLQPKPAEQPSSPELELTVEPEAPAVPGLPRTGELPPSYYYGAGAMLLLAGLLLRQRRRGMAKGRKG